MALTTVTASKKIGVALLALLGFLAIVAITACGADPEPEPAAAVTEVAASSSSVAAMEQTGQLSVASASSPAEVAIPAPPPTMRAQAAAPVISANPFLVEPLPTHIAPPELPVAPTTAPDQPADGGSSAPAAGLVYTDIGPDATWGDVYDTFSEEEKACIGEEVFGLSLDFLHEAPFGLDKLQPPVVLAMVNCISDEVAGEITLADTAIQMDGLSEEEAVCLRELLAEIPPAELARTQFGEPTTEDVMLRMSFGVGMLNCLPRLADETFSEAIRQGGGDGGGLPEDSSRLWSFSTGGWVVTAPAVSEGMVYIGSDDQSLYALDAETGALRWSFLTGDVIRSTPAVHNGTVLFGSNDNHVYAVDAATGTEMWRHDTGDWVQYTPVVNDEKVYLGAYSDGDRRVHALDATTGVVVWTAERPFPIGAQHTPTAIGNRVYAQGSEYGQFYALDAATGQVAWQAEVGGYVESAPTFIDGVVYLTVANRAYAFNEGTGEVIWEVNTEEFPARDFPALVVDGVYYLAPSSNVYALDAATGDELWSYEASMLSTAPVVEDGVLYGASGDAGTVFALDAATGQEIWKESTGGQVIQSLTAADGVLYGESDSGSLIAAAGDSGVPVWSFEKGGFSDVQGYTVVDGVIYSAGPNNSVYAHWAP